ncbi:MAG: hypothetical protein ACLUUE_05785 [Romboutsia timonensis]
MSSCICRWNYNSGSRKYSYGVVAVKDNVVEYIHGGSGTNEKTTI